jgi:hypothetical protein
LVSCQENNTTQNENTITSGDSLTNDDGDSATANNSDTTSTATLQITPLDIEGDLGQVTFTQKEKTIFYYDVSSKKGKVTLNGTEYTLDKYSFNSGSYKLSGKDVEIIAPNAKYKAPEGGDCSYGKFNEVTITSGANLLKLKDVEVQDCPNY